MASDAVRDKWNQRYQARPDTLPATPAFVTGVAPRLKPGTLLDVAAGDGAASLALARQGFAVTAVDIAEVGLARLEGFATQERLCIQTRVADLSQPESLSALGAFDNILICRYKPQTLLWPALVTALMPGGVLALGTFNLQQHEAHGFPARFCLQPAELVDIDPRLRLLEYRPVARDGDFFDEYLFIRT